MLKNKQTIIAYSILALLASCASYQASSLSMLPEHEAIQAHNNPKVLVSWKVFDERDSKTFLGRNVSSEGYIPIQLTIRNNSSDPVYLSPNNFSIPLAAVNQVTEKVHTSTAGRVVGWGVPGLIFFPFLIPAVYDGIKSSEANTALDADYQAKTLKEQTIQAHSSFTGVVFVPEEHTNEVLELFLVNEQTQDKIACPSITCTQN